MKTLLRLVAMSIALALTAFGQVHLNFGYSFASGTLFFLEDPVNFTAFAMSSSVTMDYSITNIRVVAPDGTNNFTTHTGGTQTGGGSYSSLNQLISAKSGTWTLTTNEGLATATTYTFSADFSALAGSPFVITSPTTSGLVTNPVHVTWTGPVNDGPFILQVWGQTANSTQAHIDTYSMTAGTTAADVTLDPALPWLASIRVFSDASVSFGQFTTPVTDGGLALSGWSVSEMRSESGKIMPLTVIPEPADTALLAGLASVALLGKRKRVVTLRREGRSRPPLPLTRLG